MFNMNKFFSILFVAALPALATTSSANGTLHIRHIGDGQSIVQPSVSGRYLILPVEEKAREAKMYMISDNEVVKTLNVHLAVDTIDYYVPVDLKGYDTDNVAFNIHLLGDTAVAWREMRIDNQYDMANLEMRYRPAYHFSPLYGWMNDPNGMVYKDGEYHLFYQWNPYGSMWGNMTWGHAVSKDLVSWQHMPGAILPDGLGTIFSGSCVVDHDNTAGFGKGAIVAFYTSAGECQVQSMAYSTDNGRTFKKYNRNPVLVSASRDFRDPKVFWHEDTKHWVMVLAVGQEVQFFSSPNLKDWTKTGSFGGGYGSHGGVWECPDLMPLKVIGSDRQKWVLLCNINPGGPFGGSATQYFVGNFDGKTFHCSQPADTSRWMDYGKDHYATVTWSNVPKGRKIALAWMSNWEYANVVPTKQYRSANSVPRDIFLFAENGDTLLGSYPSPEINKLRGNAINKGRRKVSAKPCEISNLISDNNGAYELNLTLKPGSAQVMRLALHNGKGEQVEVSVSMDSLTLSVDRTKSGDVGFAPSFSTVTSAPIQRQKAYDLRILVDKSSVEVFMDGGRRVLTNLVFPSDTYNDLTLSAQGGRYTAGGITVYKLGK